MDQGTGKGESMRYCVVDMAGRYLAQYWGFTYYVHCARVFESERAAINCIQGLNRSGLSIIEEEA